MLSYSLEDKKIIAIESDLLTNSLDDKEKLQWQKMNISSTLDKKISNLLSQNIKLSLELEKLNQRGITILLSSQINQYKLLTKQFNTVPTLLFIIGNKSLLEKTKVNYVFSLSEFEDELTYPTILIADQPLNQLILNQRIIKALISKNILVISDKYYQVPTLTKKIVNQLKYLYQGREHKKNYLKMCNNQLI